MQAVSRGSCWIDEPPRVAPLEVYQIGFEDGCDGRSQRSIFMLHRWSAEQQRYYEKGYRDGQDDRKALSRAPGLNVSEHRADEGVVSSIHCTSGDAIEKALEAAFHLTGVAEYLEYYRV